MLSNICHALTYQVFSSNMSMGRRGLSLLAKTLVMILKVTLQREIGQKAFGVKYLSSFGMRIMKVALKEGSTPRVLQDSSTIFQTSSLMKFQQK